MIIDVIVDGNVKDQISISEGEPKENIEARALRKVHLTRDDVCMVMFTGKAVHIVCKFLD